MYFEARTHTSIPVADAAAAVALLSSPTYCSNQCPVWTNANGQRIALVPDGHINNVTFEIAVVNIDTHEQYESLTFGWIETEEEKLRYVKACENGSNSASKAIVPFDGQNLETPAQFECSCCGEWFTSTLAKQLPHDQDAGYGFCNSCIRQIAGM